MKQRLNVRDTIISVLTSPQSLYEQSLLHHYSAQCTSIEAEVLFVSKEDLEKRLNWHRHSQDMIESFASTNPANSSLEIGVAKHAFSGGNQNLR
jgi:hypothetical protein